MSIVVEVSVKLEVNEKIPLGKKGSVVFKYCGYNETGKAVVNCTNGDIYLTYINHDVTIKFYLETKSLTYKGDTYDVSLQEDPANIDASDALWIWEMTQNAQKYSGSQFSEFIHEKRQSNGDPATQVYSSNKTLRDYYYGLSVYLMRKGQAPIPCRDDPQIKNGGIHGSLFGINVQTLINWILTAAIIALFVMNWTNWVR